LLKDAEIDSVMMGKRRFILMDTVEAYIGRLLAAPTSTSFRQSPNPHAARKRTRRQARV
jgi:hypothetical protein